MSKVYSFRLNDNNPREAQAREVIETWVSEGYSLRHVIVEALLNLNKNDTELDGLHSILDQMQELILSIDYQPAILPKEPTLSNSFLTSVKEAARLGLTAE